MKTLESIRKKAKRTLRRIVLSEGEDPRVIEAAIKAKERQVALPILIGRFPVVEELLKKSSRSITDFEVIDSGLDENLKQYSREFAGLRKNRPLSKEEALSQVKIPLNFAAMMVRFGHAEGTIGGAVATTSQTLNAALRIIGKAPNVRTVSSFFLIVLDKPYHRKKTTLIFSDCGLIIDPSIPQLRDIALQSADSFKRLVGEEPRVAMLSFSTKGSARHSKVTRMQEATNLIKSQDPNLIIDGELQFDAAFEPSVSKRKSAMSVIEGKANVMIFPNLEAANIGYKIAERIGGARAIGPILQGLSKPANDLSRGCSTEDIFDLIAVTAAQVK